MNEVDKGDKRRGNGKFSVFEKHLSTRKEAHEVPLFKNRIGRWFTQR
jgi:hypothetical protein